MQAGRMSSHIFPCFRQKDRSLARYGGLGHFCYHAFIFASTLSLHSALDTACFYHPRLENRDSLSKARAANYHLPRVTKRLISRGNGKGGEQDESLVSLDKQPSRCKDPRGHILSKSTQPEHEKILEATLDWVENVVIWMSLCPFAEKPFKNQQMHLEVIEGRDENEIVTRVLRECMVRRSKPGTSLLICPDLYPSNFLTYLQVYNILSEGVLVDNNLTGDVQIAPFHPLFEFDGSGSDGVDNYTNRSPYPMFHVLREEEVGRAVDLLDGDASRVWRRNIELLEALGKELEVQQLKHVMAGKSTDSAIKEKVKAILRDLKKRTTEI